MSQSTGGPIPVLVNGTGINLLAFHGRNRVSCVMHARSSMDPTR
jgi:hypothetical protein